MAADEVLGDDPLQRNSFAVPLGEPRLDAGHRAGDVAVPPVEKLALVQNHVVQQPFCLDVIRPLLEFGIAKLREE